jgi:hypothetical protein
MFRDLISSAVLEIAEHILNEPLTINGQPLRGDVKTESSISNGMTVDVRSVNIRIVILTSDAERIQITEGMDAEFRKERRTVREFFKDDYGFTTIELV